MDLDLNMDQPNLPGAEVKLEIITFVPASNKCDLCEKSYCSAYEVNRHRKREHEQPPPTKSIECSICDAKFGCKRSLKNHVANVHEKRRDHLCHLCTKSFFVRAYLREHIESEHEDRQMVSKCKICDQELVTENSLIAHLMEAHTKVREAVKEKFECASCGFSAEFEVSLKNHLKYTHQGMERLTKKKSLECGQCSKRYQRKNSLLTHVKTHESEPKIQP